MKYHTARFERDLCRTGLIMGVLNVTPDSFSDGGLYLDHEAALDHAREMIAQGADIIDIGGESSRPGAEPVAQEEEVRRVIPVIEGLRDLMDAGDRPVSLSIDTQKPRVAEEAVKAGADIINDITGMRDPAMRRAAAAGGAGVVIMHMQGTPQTMQKNPHYDDVTGEVADFLRAQAAACEKDGIAREKIALDPGIGFGKSLEHNLALLRAAPRLGELGYPLLYGVSRKSFLGKVIQSPELGHRLWPTVGLTAWLYQRGARVFRVHDVGENRDALLMAAALQ